MIAAILSPEVRSGIIAVLVVAVGAFLKVLIGRLDKKTDQIHILVNSRLDDALKEIKVLKRQMGIVDDVPGPLAT